MTDYRYHRTNSLQPFSHCRVPSRTEVESSLIKASLAIVSQAAHLPLVKSDNYRQRASQKRPSANGMHSTQPSPPPQEEATPPSSCESIEDRHRYEQLCRICSQDRERQQKVELLQRDLQTAQLSHGQLERRHADLQLKKLRRADNDSQRCPPLSRIAEMLARKDAEIEQKARKVEEQQQEHSQLAGHQEGLIAKSIRRLTSCQGQLTILKDQNEEAKHSYLRAVQQADMKSAVQALEKKLAIAVEGLNSEKIRSGRLQGLLAERNARIEQRANQALPRNSDVGGSKPTDCRQRLARQLNEVKQRIQHIESEEEHTIIQQIHQSALKQESVADYRNVVNQRRRNIQELLQFLDKQREQASRLEPGRAVLEEQLEDNRQIAEKLKASLERSARNFPNCLAERLEAERQKLQDKKQEYESVKRLLGQERRKMEPLMAQLSQLNEEIEQIVAQRGVGNQPNIEAMRMAKLKLERELRECRGEQTIVEQQQRSMVPENLIFKYKGKNKREYDRMEEMHFITQENSRLSGELTDMRGKANEWNENDRIGQLVSLISSLKSRAESLQHESKEMKKKNTQGLLKLSEYEQMYQGNSNHCPALPQSSCRGQSPEIPSGTKQRTKPESRHQNKPKPRNRQDKKRKQSLEDSSEQLDESVIQQFKAEATSRHKGSRALCSKNLLNRVKQFNHRQKEWSSQPQQDRPAQGTPGFSHWFLALVVGLLLVIILFSAGLV